MLDPNSNLPEWRRAHGTPSIRGIIKQNPNDFRVTEHLGFELSSDGEHDYLWVEKERANTPWVARGLAEHAGVPLRDVGYAGLKDRHAVTRQWFSVRRPSGAGTDWSAFSQPSVEILDVRRHQKKLKRGAHSANDFYIVIRGTALDADELRQNLQSVKVHGVPNYFGPQRFGRNARNVDLAKSIFTGKRVSRDKRSIALSAARSWIFNEILSERVTADTWNKALDGDCMNLGGTNSIFVPDMIDRQIQDRTSSMDIHPTGAMWGDGNSPSSGPVNELEDAVAARNLTLARGLEDARVKQSRRPLRLVVSDFEWDINDTMVALRFRLARGCFATAVLRELIYDS